jgi:hypothetical protein
MTLSESYKSTIIEVKACFGIEGFSEDPDKITEALNINPVEIRRKGEIKKLRNGHEIEIKENQWSIESTSKSKDINDHLRELLKKLNGKESLIKVAWNPSFSILWKGNYLYAGSGPFFERDVIKGIARLGADLWQDIYQIDEEEN